LKQDGAHLEFIALEFSNSDVILGLSGVPDMKVTLWNCFTGDTIGSFDLTNSMLSPESIRFCPTNWRQICFSYKDEIIFWKVEQCDKICKFTKTSSRMPLLQTDDDSDNEFAIAPSLNIANEFDYTKSAITGTEEKYNDAIEKCLDKKERHQLACTCWISASELLIATLTGSIYKLNFTNSTTICIFNGGGNKIIKMNLHRKALFITFANGTIKLAMVTSILNNTTNTGQTITMKDTFDIKTNRIANLTFNTNYTKLAINTNNGIYTVDCVNLFNGNSLNEGDGNSLVKLVLSYDRGIVVGVGNINPYNENFLVLRSEGSAQVWSSSSCEIINKIQLSQTCTSLAMSPQIQLAVIGTADGHLIFMDFSNVRSPRVLEKCLVHKGTVKLLKFNPTGSLLFSVGEDGRLFVIDTRLTEKTKDYIIKLDQALITNYENKKTSFYQGFYVLGYLEFESEAICMDAFDSITNEASGEVSTKVCVGLHDLPLWEQTRKQILDTSPTMTSSGTPEQQTAVPRSMTRRATAIATAMSSSSSVGFIQNILLQSTQPLLNRLENVNPLISKNYDESNTVDKVKLCSKILVFELNLNMFDKQNKEQIYTSKKLEFKDEAINKNIVHTLYLFNDCLLTTRSYLLCSLERFLAKFTIPEFDPNKKAAKLSFLELNEVVGGHDFGYGIFARSNNNQFVVSAHFDGLLTIRKINDLKEYTEARCIHYSNGGFHKITFQNDCSKLVGIGHESTVFTFDWTSDNEKTQILKTKSPPNNNIISKSELQIMSGSTWQKFQENLQKSSNTSWLDIKEKEFFNEEDKEQLPIKTDIHNGLIEIRLKLQQLMKENATREDLAKLKDHEFYLDLDELDRLQKEAEQQMLKIREDAELDDLSKLFIREVIKKECWDNMKEKGRTIHAFNSNLLVENYALKEQNRQEIEHLERIKLIRRIELATQKVRNELTHDILKRDNINELAEIDDKELNKDSDLPLPPQSQQISSDSNTATTAVSTTNVGNKANDKDVPVLNTFMSPNLSQFALKGSIGGLFNGDSPLFYHQFELYNREQMNLQILLIKDAIQKIKDNFNKEFENVTQRKYQEIAKIKEKSQRLQQIYSDLSEEKKVEDLNLGDVDNPQTMFEVKDNEIKVEKYLTPEQQRLLDERLAEEAKRAELDRMDNWRDRGLMDMMGGVLQIRREDELKKVIIASFFHLVLSLLIELKKKDNNFEKNESSFFDLTTIY
jgi:WD40 repeat protein